MPRPSLNDIQNLPDFSRLIRWNLYVDTIPSALTGQLPADITSGVSNGMNVRCESVEIPTYNTIPIDLRIRGIRYKDIGISEPVGVWTATFVETVDNYISKFISAWREAIWSTNTSNPDGSSIGISNKTKSLKGTVRIVRLDQSDSEVYSYKLIGAWLESYQMGMLDGQTPDVIRPVLMFSYDGVIEESLV